MNPKRRRLAAAFSVCLAAVVLLALWLWVIVPWWSGIEPACHGGGCSIVWVAIGAAEEEEVHGVHWYNFSVVSAAEGLLWGDIGMEVEDPSGLVVSLNSSWSIQINQSHSEVVAQYDPVAGAWSKGAGVPVGANQLIVLDANGSNLTQRGFTLVLSGLGSYSGQVSAAIP